MTRIIQTDENILIQDTGRKNLSDRRKCSTPVVSRYTLFGGRRKTIRREKDRKKHLFVDLYSTRLLIAVLLLLCLSCADAYLTLTLIDKGIVSEANPFMAFFLTYGSLYFVVTKFVITAFSLTVLCLFKNVRITRICLPCAITVYILIIIYELLLLAGCYLNKIDWLALQGIMLC